MTKSESPARYHEAIVSGDAPKHHVFARISLALLIAINLLSVTAASVWAVVSWKQFIEYRGAWSLWPVFWLGGSAGILLAQLLLSLLPTYLVIRTHRARPLGLCILSWTLCLAGILITVFSVAWIFYRDSTMPKVNYSG